jgi:hypothetical protein
MANTGGFEGLGTPCSPPEGRTFNDAAGFASCYGPLACSPFTGPSTLGFDPTRFQTEPPACYRAPWQLPGPDSHRQATTSFQPSHDRKTITSRSLGEPAAVLDEPRF